MALAIETRAPARGGAPSPAKPLLLALALLLVGFGLWAVAGVPFRQAATHVAARDWPVVEASIAAVALSEEVDLAGRGAGRTLRLSADYRYAIDGVSYRGDRASLSDTGSVDDRRLKSLYGQLRFAEVTGRTVTIAYDPADPARSFVDTGFPWRTALLMGALGFCALAVGLGIAIAALGRARTRG